MFTRETTQFAITNPFVFALCSITSHHPSYYKLITIFCILKALPEHGVYTVFVELDNTKIEVRVIIYLLILHTYLSTHLPLDTLTFPHSYSTSAYIFCTYLLFHTLTPPHTYLSLHSLFHILTSSHIHPSTHVPL